jgi:hypothetical protein
MRRSRGLGDVYKRQAKSRYDVAFKLGTMAPRWAFYF